MCTATIIDASVFALLDKSEMEPLIEWIIRGDGKVISYGGRYRKELEGNKDALRFIDDSVRWRGGRDVRDDDLKRSKAILSRKKIQSNDRHILELAHAGNVRMLCTKDKVLMQDFKNKNILPKVEGSRKVYPINKTLGEQRNFLGRERCPKRLPGPEKHSDK